MIEVQGEQQKREDVILFCNFNCISNLNVPHRLARLWIYLQITWIKRLIPSTSPSEPSVLTSRNPSILLFDPTMKLLPTLLAAALSLTHLASGTPSGLEIEYLTPEIECTRKTTKGDQIEVHYRGSLQSTGEEFDSSYSRGRPLPFKLGAGAVIKG